MITDWIFLLSIDDNKNDLMNRYELKKCKRDI